MEKYEKRIENLMCTYYSNLSEKDKRHYAAIEAEKLYHGGINYIADLFDCCRQTIISGIDELKRKEIAPTHRIRHEGGGRISTAQKCKNINEIFLSVVAEHTAGDPMDEKIKWTKLTRTQISLAMKKLGVSASRNIVRKLLKKHGFVKRKLQRKRATGEFKDRDKQFHNIESIKKKFMKSDNPIISIDTKKKEKLGNLHRKGEVYCTKAIETYDHDYPHLSTGTIVPHGIYDMKRNEAIINIGIDNETAEFICDSILNWWNKRGKVHYIKAIEMLIYCDAGGANSYRHNRFKVALQKLANLIGLSIRLCHYPPYTSKWNPIEHKVFPHVTRSMAGVVLNSVDNAKALIKTTKTKTGLKVFVSSTKKIYKTGITYAKTILDNINITMHGELGNLNYTVSPSAAR
jgi:hypothetical protein